MDISEVYKNNKNTLTGADLKKIGDTEVEIEKIETVTYDGVDKLKIYFRDRERTLVSNKVNAETIADKYGPDTDNWIGKRIILFPAKASFDGRTVDAIRVRHIQEQKKLEDDDLPF